MRANFVFREVAIGLRRNVTMTVAMLLTTAISLGLLGAGILAVRIIDRTQALYYDQLAVQVGLTDDVSASDSDCSKDPCRTLEAELRAIPLVESVTFESRQEAYQKFEKAYQGQAILDLVRPQGLPATLRVTLTDPQRSDVVRDAMTGKPGVKNVIDQRALVDKLFSFLSSIRNATFALALVQALAALLLISNTVQVSAFTRRTEVGIMRLVGATRWYTQLPFLIEAVLTGIVGALLAIVGLVLGKVLFVDRILGTVFENNVIPRVPMSDVLLIASPLMLVIGAAIAAVTGYVTLRLYVRT